MMEVPSVCFSKAFFDWCSIENKRKICSALDCTLNSFLPIQDDETDNESLRSTLKFRYLLSIDSIESSEESDNLFNKIAGESLALLEKQQETYRESYQVLLSICEDAMSLISDSRFADIAPAAFIESQAYLSEVFSQPWSDEITSELPKTIIHINRMASLLSVATRRKQMETISCQDHKLVVLILCLASSRETSVSSLVTTNLLSKLLQNGQNFELKSQLWELMAGQVDRDSVFMLLCSTIELFLQTEDLFVLNRDEFWQLMHRGVTHADQAIRKQTRYMMKRAIDAAVTNRVSINLQHFHWDQTSSLDAWNKFFLVIESLEEKQVHLVKPVFPIVESLFSSLNVKWALCGLNQVLQHDNNYVIKHGVLLFLKLAPSEDTKTFMICKVLPVLNNSVLYQTEGTGKIPEVSTKLSTFLSSIATSQDGVFFKKLLQGIRDISWAPIPLYYVTQALGNLPHISAWNQEDLLVLKKFLIDVIACHSVYLRAATQSMLLSALRSLTDVSSCDLTTVAELLSMFPKTESLSRGLIDWRLTSEWLQAITPEPFLSQCQQPNRLSASATARMLLLLCDAGLVIEDYITELLQGIALQLQNCETRLYIDHNQVDTSLEFLVCCIEESNYKHCIEETNGAVRCMLNAITSMGANIVSYLNIRLTIPLSIHDFHSVQLYVKVLQVLGSFLRKASYQVQQLLDTAVVISLNADNELAVQKYLAAVVIEWCCENIAIYDADHPPNSWVDVQEVIEAYIVKAVSLRTLNLSGSRPQGTELTRDLQTLWGRAASGMLHARWTSLGSLLPLAKLPAEVVLTLALEGIELGGPDILSAVMRALACCLHEHEDISQMTSLLELCYKLSMQHRKSDLFWLSIRQFIAMTLKPAMLQRGDLEEYLIQIVDRLHEHSQTVMGLFNLVVSQASSSHLDSSVLAHIFALGLLFGPAVTKEQKIVNSTCAHIAELGDSIPANSLLDSQCEASVEVRVMCIRALLAPQVSIALVERVVQEIVEQERTMVVKKIKYFAQSQLHFRRLRAAQALLMLQPLVSQTICGELLFWACDSLVQESHQPSVRYVLEWLCARLLNQHPEFEDEFLTTMHQAVEKRQGSLSSFISILYLWMLCCVQSRQSELPRLIEQAVQLILPWTMAQHYNIRLYAQVALLKLWSISKAEGLEDFVEYLRPLQVALQSSLDHGCAVKNALQLQDDFFFSVFHPLRHFSLQTIFHNILRLSNVNKEEWITSETFIQDKCKSHTEPYAGLVIALSNPDDVLDQCQVAGWILRSAGGGPGEVEEEEGNGHVVQRKVIPWRDQVLMGREQRGQSEGLVVVASLVDRAPNLGGLSRTCEALAASRLVLHNLRITQDPLFQSLSVSADKWLPLSEVRPHDLPGYLTSMKAQGYTLVAAEQTSHSVPLQHMAFPKKTLLLLGNEKEGIPAELLPLVDVCVEVPQRGVVRSLNVHVTGALFIWRYFIQHHLSSATSH